MTTAVPTRITIELHPGRKDEPWTATTRVAEPAPEPASTPSAAHAALPRETAAAPTAYEAGPCTCEDGWCECDHANE